MTDQGEVRPRIDYERRIFVARDGTEVHLKPMSALVLERLYNDNAGKPKVPKVEVVIAGKEKRLQDNPDDPDYLKALERWTGEKNIRLTRYCLMHGVADDPPDEFVDRYREFFPNSPVDELRYLWMVELLGDDKEDWELIVQAMMGQTAVTQRGVAQATEQFPDSSERLAG